MGLRRPGVSLMESDLRAVLLGGPTMHLLGRHVTVTYGENREQLFDVEGGWV